MALAIDASSPAMSSAQTTTTTTAAFTTPANVLLIAMVGRNVSVAGGSATGTVSGAGLTWTLAGRKSAVGTGQIAGGTAQDGCFEIWWAYSAAALTAQTVTDTGGAIDHALNVLVITGAETTWAGAIAAGGGSGTSAVPTATVTTTAAGSWVISGDSDWNASGTSATSTPGTGQTSINNYWRSGQIAIHFWRQTSTTSASGTAVTNDLTAPTGQTWNELAIEVRASGSGGAATTAPHRLQTPRVAANRASTY